jgi:hypothetical protein
MFLITNMMSQVEKSFDKLQKNAGILKILYDIPTNETNEFQHLDKSPISKIAQYACKYSKT